MKERYLEDFEAGQTFQPERIRIDVDRIKSFAAEFDPQPFHLDERAVASTENLFLFVACLLFWVSESRNSYLFLRYTGQIAFAKSGSEADEDEFTGFDGIFFIRPVILQWKSAACDTFIVHLLSLGLLANHALVQVYLMMGIAQQEGPANISIFR